MKTIIDTMAAWRMISLSAVLCMLFMAPIAATDYYVKKTGNDAFDGTSYATAKKTIQAALNLATAGSNVYIDAGVYKERIWWPASGAAGSPIRLTNYNGATVNIDGGAGGTNSTQNALLAIGSKSHIEISNLRFRNNYRSYASGIYIAGEGTAISILNCLLYNIGWTASATAFPGPGDNANPLVVLGDSANPLSDILISGNRIFNNITGYSEGVAINGNVTDFIVENNTVYDNTNIGIVAAGHYAWTGAPASVNFARNGVIRGNVAYNNVSQVAVSAGIYIDGASDIIVEKNKSYANGVGYSIGCENANQTVSGIHLRNNWAYQNREVGIQFGAIGSGSQVSNCIVSHNSLFSNYAIGGFGAEIALSNGSNNTIHHNILVPRSDSCVAVGIWSYTMSGLLLDYNLYWRPNGNTGSMWANTGPDMHPVYGHPRFLKTNTTLPKINLHIALNSKALNAGNPAFVPAAGETDCDGQARLQGVRVDIGSDEIPQPTLLLTDVEEWTSREEAGFSVYPNPASDKVTVHAKEAQRVVLLAMDGTHLWEMVPEDGQEWVVIDVSRLPAGVVWVVIQDAKGRFSSLQLLVQP